MVYYQSYNNLISDQLNAEMNATGNQQDCLGMTPLHILSCSTIGNLSLYHALIEKFPNSLITEDGVPVPLLYVVWGKAPNEIIQFLLECYTSHYPDTVWRKATNLSTLTINSTGLRW